MSTEAKKFASIRMTGKNNPNYGKRGKDSPNYGKRRSSETIERLSGANNPMYGKKGEKHPRFGKHPTTETLEKMSIAASGKIPSEETRLKLSAALKGRKCAPFTDEHRAKISAARKNQVFTPEQKKKMRERLAKHRLLKHSPDTIKKLSELASMRLGDKNPNWKGGLSFEPYCPKWTPSLKKRIREFFDNRCVLCGKDRHVQQRNLSCHHVEYNKQACCDGKPVQFAALCAKCHAKTNHERERWEAMIHRIIDEVYDGRSYYTEEEYAKLTAK